MAKCPACGRDLLPGATECFGCGVILDRWRPRPERPSTAQRPAEPRRTPSPHPGPAPSAPGGTSLVRALLVGSALGLLVVGGYYYVEIRPRVAVIEDPTSQAEPGRAAAARARHDPVADCDLELDLGTGPLGLTWTGSRFLAGNRGDPWGFLEIVPDDEDVRRFSLREWPVVERRYARRVSFWAVAWNGEEVVAVADGSWFQRPDAAVFTVHDPETLQIERVRDAPPLLGCLAYDGESYWAATRRNTEGAREEAWLYRLDQDLGVVGRFAPPGVGCQGLAWDGELLWHADVFSGELSALDVHGTPRVVLVHHTRFDYPSGLAHDGENLWLAEYDADRLHRIHPMLRAAWHRRVFGSLEMTVEVAGRVVARHSWQGDDTATDGLPAGELDGVWFGGEPGGDDDDWTLMVRAGRYFVQGPDRTAWVQGTYEVVSAGRPAQIDFRVERCDCDDAGETSRSLYELRDDDLTLAMNEPGAPRPRSLRGGEARLLRFTR